MTMGDAGVMRRTEALVRRGLELGLSDIAVASAADYVTAERIIRERGAAGLFADLKFAMAHPERSCRPRVVLPGAESVISAALCYWHPDPPRDEMQPAATGTIARYTRFDAYAALEQRLLALADDLIAAGHNARVLVDSNDHVDRAAAIASGLGFSSRNTSVITRRHGSWVVLGTIITDAVLDPGEPMRPGCGSCTRCVDACPTGALDQAGVLDSTLCISYWLQSRHDIPDAIQDGVGSMLYGCDICQDVCPWNRGVERRRGDLSPLDGEIPLSNWLDLSHEELVSTWDRLYIPRRDSRFLRRNALLALAASSNPLDAALAVPWLQSSDGLLRRQARSTLERIGGHIAAAALDAVDRGELIGES